MFSWSPNWVWYQHAQKNRAFRLIFWVPLTYLLWKLVLFLQISCPVFFLSGHYSPIIYCQKFNCKENRYIVKSGWPLKYRLAEHRGYVLNQTTSNATGAHLNSPGHSLSDMKVLISQNKKCRIHKRKGEILYS